MKEKTKRFRATAGMDYALSIAAISAGCSTSELIRRTLRENIPEVAIAEEVGEAASICEVMITFARMAETSDPERRARPLSSVMYDRVGAINAKVSAHCLDDLASMPARAAVLEAA